MRSTRPELMFEEFVQVKTPARRWQPKNCQHDKHCHDHWTDQSFEPIRPLVPEERGFLVRGKFGTIIKARSTGIRRNSNTNTIRRMT